MSQIWQFEYFYVYVPEEANVFPTLKKIWFHWRIKPHLSFNWKQKNTKWPQYIPALTWLRSLHAVNIQWYTGARGSSYTYYMYGIYDGSPWQHHGIPILYSAQPMIVSRICMRVSALGVAWSEFTSTSQTWWLSPSKRTQATRFVLAASIK